MDAAEDHYAASCLDPHLLTQLTKWSPASVFVYCTLCLSAAFPMNERRIGAVYAVRADPASVAERAQALALEQSVELPLAAIRDARVRDDVVARVESIAPRDDGRFTVRLGLAAETVAGEPGQLMNMLFGNSSLHDDVELVDIDVHPDCARAFGGPRFGIAGWRSALDAHDRPLTCSALKPLGLPPRELARIAEVYARAGVDVIKDDHGLADQPAAPFADRVRAVQDALDRSQRATGRRSVYAPSLTGSHDAIRAQMRIARDCGVGAFMVAPMVSGVAALALVAREAGVPMLAHPALAGIARIAPPLLWASCSACSARTRPSFRTRAAASATRVKLAWRSPMPRERRGPGSRRACPCPAGGMSVERVPEMRVTFGIDTMLLIGGSLLAAGDALAQRCADFVAAVREPETVK